jgi:hypothetical protein
VESVECGLDWISIHTPVNADTEITACLNQLRFTRSGSRTEAGLGGSPGGTTLELVWFFFLRSLLSA